jgi:hypothetical protein
MYKIFLIFSFIFFFKSIIIKKFYTNYMMCLLFPLEIAGISLITPNYNKDNISNIYKLNTYLRWTLVNWFGTDEDYNLLESFDETNNLIIILSWVLAYFVYQISYLIYNIIIKKKITKVMLLKHNLKYLLINYTSLYLWSLVILLDLKDINFWYVFINILIFNFIVFWFPGVIFNFIYGDKLYYYREHYSFLLEDYNLKYKYFTIILLSLKFLTGIFIILFKYWERGSKMFLFNILLLYNLIIYYNNIFRGKVKFPIYLLSILSSIILVLSIISDYYYNNLFIIILKYILVIIYFIKVIYFYNSFYNNNNNLIV